MATVTTTSRGAVASGRAFAGEATCPALLIPQAGTYDPCAWDDWVEDGAPGGDLETARAIRANQRREAGDDRAALRARSAILALPDTASDVLAGLVTPPDEAGEDPS